MAVARLEGGLRRRARASRPGAARCRSRAAGWRRRSAAGRCRAGSWGRSWGSACPAVRRDAHAGVRHDGRVTTSTPQPGWYADPAGVFDLRWWDGARWTDAVVKDGVTSTSPLPDGRGPVQVSSVDYVKHQVQQPGGRRADRPAASGTLFTEPVLVVNQKAKLIELTNEYAVYDQAGRPLGQRRRGRPERAEEGRAVPVQRRPVPHPQARGPRRAGRAAAAAGPAGQGRQEPGRRRAARRRRGRPAGAGERLRQDPVRAVERRPAGRLAQRPELAGLGLPDPRRDRAPRSPGSRRPSRASPRPCSPPPTTTSCRSTGRCRTRCSRSWWPARSPSTPRSSRTRGGWDESRSAWAHRALDGGARVARRCRPRATRWRRVEEQGWGSLWFGEAYGREAFTAAQLYLGASSRLVLGTGIASIYGRDAVAANAAARTVAGGLPGPVRARARGEPRADGRADARARVRQAGGGDAGVPRRDGRGAVRWRPAAWRPPRVLAALGPKMLELARDRADGRAPVPRDAGAHRDGPRDARRGQAAGRRAGRRARRGRGRVAPAGALAPGDLHRAAQLPRQLGPPGVHATRTSCAAAPSGSRRRW